MVEIYFSFALSNILKLSILHEVTEWCNNVARQNLCGGINEKVEHSALFKFFLCKMNSKYIDSVLENPIRYSA